MKKTIIAITLFSFTFQVLNVHMHEHADHADHASHNYTVEQDCDFCQFNSENSFVELYTAFVKINFKVIIFESFVE